MPNSTNLPTASQTRQNLKVVAHRGDPRFAELDALIEAEKGNGRPRIRRSQEAETTPAKHSASKVGPQGNHPLREGTEPEPPGPVHFRSQTEGPGRAVASIPVATETKTPRSARTARRDQGHSVASPVPEAVSG